MEQITTSGVQYAGFWKRVLAAILDGLLVGAAAWILGGSGGFGNMGWGHMSGSYGDGYGYGMMRGGWSNASNDIGPIKLVIGWLYYSFMESSVHQATLGKMALGIKVTNESGARIGFGQATGRFFGKILSAIILGIGFLMVAFTAKKQGLHDKLAHTLVVNKYNFISRLFSCKVAWVSWGAVSSVGRARH
jgi:uncharacterized RDD family membrane protein YckC